MQWYLIISWGSCVAIKNFFSKISIPSIQWVSPRHLYSVGSSYIGYYILNTLYQGTQGCNVISQFCLFICCCYYKLKWNWLIISFAFGNNNIWLASPDHRGCGLGGSRLDYNTGTLLQTDFGNTFRNLNWVFYEAYWDRWKYGFKVVKFLWTNMRQTSFPLCFWTLQKRELVQALHLSLFLDDEWHHIQ